MNFSFFTARRIAFSRQKTFSRSIIRLSVVTASLSVVAMILTLSFVNGFQKAVSEKVFSLWGHIRVQNVGTGNKSASADEIPIERSDKVLRLINEHPQVSSVQAFATKSAVVEFGKEIDGILFKGIEKLQDTLPMHTLLQAGRLISFNDSAYSKEILLSTPMANELQVQLNDKINVLFISSDAGETTLRQLRVVGIYKTGIEDYDNLFAIGDLRLIQRLNNWNKNKIGGYEIFLSDYTQLDSISHSLYQQLPMQWSSKTMKEVFPNIFSWLNMQNTNKSVIIIVMAIVAVINLITCLLILVLERTHMIGILKSIGARDWGIQKIFIYYAALIAIEGIAIGCVLGIGICKLQEYTHIIKLDEATYYTPYAPIYLIWWQVALVCLCTAIVCFVSLIVPSMLVKKIVPVKALRFS